VHSYIKASNYNSFVGPGYIYKWFRNFSCRL